MPVTRSAPLALAKDSRLLMSSNAGARLAVNGAPTSTVITAVSTSELTNLSLYSKQTKGMVVISQCATSPSTNQGKTANITGISGNAITVDVDFSTILATGDIIVVIPPLSVEMFLPSGHTLNSMLTNDYTMGIGETFDTQNTPMTIDEGGDVPFFQIVNSEGFARILAAGIGSYKSTTPGTHVYRPDQANDGTFTNMQDSTFYAQDGNGVLRNMFHGNFATKLVLDYPEGARGTGTLSVTGNGSAREIGGTGRTFPSGTKTTRSVSDAVFNSTTTITSATAAFVAGDVGSYVIGTGVPLDTYIVTVNSGTSITVSAATTSTGSGNTIAITDYNFLRGNFPCDTGAGLTFRSAFIDLGGTFGTALSNSPLTTVKNMTITIEKGMISDRTLGDPYIVKPAEDMVRLTITGTRILQDNTFDQYAKGGANDATPDTGAKFETRVLVKAILANDPTKTLSFDVPRGVFSSQKPIRQRGRFQESFEYRMLATVDANGCVSTAIPPFQATLVSSNLKNVSTAI